MSYFKLVSKLILYSLIAAAILISTSSAFAATVTLDRVIPSSGISYNTVGTFVTPSQVITTFPISTDQNLSGMLDNDPDTFYQPAIETDPSITPDRSIGTDVLLDFDFPPIPDNATIESVTLRVGISDETTDGPFLRGFFFGSYNRLDLTTYLDVDLGPDIVGAFIVSDQTTPFPFSPLSMVQVAQGSVFEMNLAPEELTLDNVRNLSVIVGGLNDARVIFDRTTLVNATVVYSVPDSIPNIPTLSDWGIIILAGVLGITVLIAVRRKQLSIMI